MAGFIYAGCTTDCVFAAGGVVVATAGHRTQNRCGFYTNSMWWWWDAVRMIRCHGLAGFCYQNGRDDGVFRVLAMASCLLALDDLR